MYEAAFHDLRRLADWFSGGPPRSSGCEIERLVQRLGTTAIPLLCRELCGAEPSRRDAARDALAAVAADGETARARVTAELHAITGGRAPDEAKVVALGLLSELGEHADVRFADPAAIRARSAIALAAHLETAADVASAADLMVRQLEAADILQMLEVMADAAPDAAHRLATELALRLDLVHDLRDRIARLAASIAAGRAAPCAASDWRDGTRTAVLVDAAARRVVIASRPLGGRSSGRRGWRRWAVLIGPSGRIEDCLHEDDAGPYGDTAALRAELCGDGYRVASLEPDDAHEVVAAAARLTAGSTRALPPTYYLGRDLLDLGDAHLGGRGLGDPGSAALARALELIAAGEPARAEAVLERCDPDHPEVAAALATALLAQHRPAEALAALRRAVRAEPDWPLHHWNLAVAYQQLGDDRGGYHALRQFVATSAIPSGLAGDPEQPARLARAERRIAELERAAWLVGRPLCRPARRPRVPVIRPLARGAARRQARPMAGPTRPIRPIRPIGKKKRTSAT
ncbi:MAG TPA: tetratricopeptide repeat protein [Kofleriaceae bacterium]|nr:tetratricopeptide repeat protein [Kofleriaceae bacterium]